MNVMPDLRLQELQLDLHLLAELAVEGAERFVEEEKARPVDQGPGEGDPLLLAAGELARLPVRERRHLHHLERLAHLLGDLGLVLLLLPEAVGDVLRHAHVREQREVLEDRVHVPLVGRRALDSLAGDEDLARRGLLEPGQHPQGGGLPTTRGAEEGQEFGRLDLERESIHGDDVGESLRDVDKLDRTFFAQHALRHPHPGRTDRGSLTNGPGSRNQRLSREKRRRDRRRSCAPPGPRPRWRPGHRRGSGPARPGRLGSPLGSSRRRRRR